MPTDYPGAIDDAFATHEDAEDAILAVQTELGPNPQSRLNARPSLVAGRDYDGSESVAGTNTTFAALRLWAGLWAVHRTLTVDRLGIQVSGAAAAGVIARLGIYSSSSGMVPDALLASTGDLAIDSTGFKSETLAPVTLAPGVYWLACLTPATTGTIRGRSQASAPVLGFPSGSNADAPSTGTIVRSDGMTGVTALPGTFGTVNNYSQTVPSVRARVASIL